jgi:hypothetical protein
MTSLYCISAIEQLDNEELIPGDRIILTTQGAKQRFVEIVRLESDYTYTTLCGPREIDANLDVLRVKLCREHGVDPRGLFNPHICHTQYKNVIDILVSTLAKK